MRSRSEQKLILGVLIWVGLLIAGIVFMRNVLSDKAGAPFLVARFLSTPIRKVELEFMPDEVFRVGTPIFLEQGETTLLVGRIIRVNELSSVEKGYVYSNRAFADIFSNAPEIGADAYLTFHTTPDSFAWVVEMMFPPETRKQIGDLILAAYKEHQKEIVTAFRPIVEDSIRDSSEIIREDLRRAIAKHEIELTRLGEKFQTDLIETEIIPLVRNEIWPVVRHEARPLVTQIGLEIWEEVSLWRFTWKYLYDTTPLPERNLAQKEFRRFVNHKAIPIMEAHIGDMIDVQKRILSRVSQNDEVKETVSRSIRNVLRDPQVQQLVTKIFREVFVNNPRLARSP